MKRAFPKLILTALFLVLSLAPLSLGCGLQGEGERCDVLNNSDAISRARPKSSHAKRDVRKGLCSMTRSSMAGLEQSSRCAEVVARLTS